MPEVYGRTRRKKGVSENDHSPTGGYGAYFHVATTKHAGCAECGLAKQSLEWHFRWTTKIFHFRYWRQWRTCDL